MLDGTLALRGNQRCGSTQFRPGLARVTYGEIESANQCDFVGGECAIRSLQFTGQIDAVACIQAFESDSVLVDCQLEMAF